LADTPSRRHWPPAAAGRLLSASQRRHFFYRASRFQLIITPEFSLSGAFQVYDATE